MKLDDFLKVKKVKCVKGRGGCLTAGKEYSVLDIRMQIKVKDDEDEDCYWESDHFEPVLESAENPPQKMELTPEFEAVEPKFKVGDKVYVGLTGRVAKVTEIIDDEVVSVANENNKIRVWTTNICHATQENYEMILKLYPHIEIELPTKQLTSMKIRLKQKGVSE